MKNIIIIAAIIMLTGCASLAAQPQQDESQAVAQDKKPELVKSRFFAIGRTDDGKKIFMRLIFDKDTGLAYFSTDVKQQYWDDPPTDTPVPEKKDAPVEGDKKD